MLTTVNTNKASSDDTTDKQQWENTLADYDSVEKFRDVTQKIREGWTPPSNYAPVRTPLILDTDIGGDPDDAIAVALAARRFPERALVITTDEHRGGRARFARQFLDLLGRPEVVPSKNLSALK